MKYKFIVPLLLMMWAVCASAQKNEVISVIKKEIDRNMEQLRIDKLKPPFFINYNLIDTKRLQINAVLGSVAVVREHNLRNGAPKVLVGDYNRNNTNFRNPYNYYRYVSRENSGLTVPVWADVDRMYKNAAENYEAKMAVIAQQKLDEEDLNLPDFDKVESVSLIIDPAKTMSEKAFWENYAVKSSAIVKKYPDILESSVEVVVRNSMQYICNTENTEIAMPDTYYQVRMHLSTITGDGQSIDQSLQIAHTTFEQMPALQQFIDTCEIFIRKFIELSQAPMLQESYCGPVLFEGQAVPEILQSQISVLYARRASVERSGSGNNMEMMKDKKVMSRALSLKSLSGTESYKGKKLDGYYPVDNEGVKPDKELTLIENGVLKNMLNGRTPTKKFPRSNGHCRHTFDSHNNQIIPGNILCTSNITFSPVEIRKKLLAAAKEEDLEYAYVVRNSTGTSPREIYRVYVSDGREERVSGVSLPDLNLKSFKRIVGTSDQEYFYTTGAHGALVTYIVPDAILFEELEVTKNNAQLKAPFIVAKPEVTK